MQSNQLQVDDLAITVYDSQGSGPAAIFIHGNSANANTFKGQLEGPLGQKYRLIALDLPGHGTSGRATETVYNLPGYAKVVGAIAQQMDLTEAVLIGWSLGGHIALEAVKHFPEGRGVMIWGTPPVGIPPAMDQAFLPNPAMGAAFSNSLTHDEITAFGAASLRPGATVDADFFEAFDQTDGAARVGLFNSLGAVNYEDEVKIVGNLNRPIAILQGEHEQLVNLNYLRSLNIPTLWRGEVQVIPGAGHSPQIEAPDAFNALVDAFLSDTTKD